MKSLYVLILLFIVAGCSLDKMHVRKREVKEWLQEDGKLRVLAMTAMIGDLVSYIGGDRVKVLTLIPRGADPHTYQLVRGDGEKIARADFIFCNGLNLEHGASLQAALESCKNVIFLGNKLPVESLIYVDGEKDPHIWMDIALFSETIPFIVEALELSCPDSGYKVRGEMLKKQMELLHKEIQKAFMVVPPERRYLVTCHDAFNYFARAYLATSQEREENRGWRERFYAPLGLTPDREVSLKDLDQVMSYIREHKVHVIFSESNVNNDVVKKLCEVAHVLGWELVMAEKPLYADSLGEEGSGASTYPKMVQRDQETILFYWR